MTNALNPKIQKRVERRLSELQSDPSGFIRRFDQNGDGVLDENEMNAAVATLSNELLRENHFAESLRDADLKPGVILRNRYTVVSEIGSGAQGVAYAARDNRTQNLVVVKQLRLSHLDAWESYDAFRREAEILQKLNHPRLPSYIETFEISSKGKFFYFSVQSLMPGINLEDRILSGEFFNEEMLVSIAQQTLEILHYLHQNTPSILHRDIKPSNLLMDEKGDIYLVDFGAVQYAKSSKTMAIGTAGYMASEQLAGAALPQSDLYSLGATLVRLASRKEPVELDFVMMRMQWRAFVSLSMGFSNWIDKLIDPEVEDRFLNAKSALRFLKKRSSVFVRKERKDLDHRLSLELVECVRNKPDTAIKIWESVDQFVCTFPPSRLKNDKGNVFEVFKNAFSNMFKSNYYRPLSQLGGGFSFTSQGVVYIESSQRKLLEQKITGIEIEHLDDGKAITVTYTISTNETTQKVHSICILGMNREEFKWVFHRLTLFLSGHRLKLIT